GRNYILRLAGSDNSLIYPGGDGFGTLSVRADGTFTCIGILGDATRFAQSSFVSAQGLWPFFASPYGGQGLILGWLSFTNNAINGPVFWSRLTLPGRILYPGGFNFATSAAGSVYAFTNGHAVLSLTNGVVKFQNGGLSENLMSSVTL